MLLSIHSGVDCRYLCSQCSHAQCWLFSAVIGRPGSSCAPIGRGPPPMSPHVTLPLGPHPHCHTVTLTDCHTVPRHMHHWSQHCHCTPTVTGAMSYALIFDNLHLSFHISISLHCRILSANFRCETITAVSVVTSILAPHQSHHYS